MLLGALRHSKAVKQLDRRKRVVARYAMMIGVKGTSSMKLRREISNRQAAAWRRMQRIREGIVESPGLPSRGSVKDDKPRLPTRSSVRDEARSGRRQSPTSTGPLAACTSARKPSVTRSVSALATMSAQMESRGFGRSLSAAVTACPAGPARNIWAATSGSSPAAKKPRDLDTLAQVAVSARVVVGRDLRYMDPIADNEFPGGARS